MSYRFRHEYCHTNFPRLSEQYLEECQSDPICATYGGYYDCGWAFDVNEDCSCTTTEGPFVFMIFWWIFLCILTLVEIVRLYLLKNIDFTTEPTVNFHTVIETRHQNCASHCVCCKLIFYDSTHRDMFLENIFWKRLLWMLPTGRMSEIFVLSLLTRYGIYVLFAFIFYALYTPEVESDANIDAMDIYPVCVLIVIKIMLQIYYFSGNEYDRHEDWTYEIQEILVDVFGNGLGSLVQSYLPIFYDGNRAPLERFALESDSQSSQRNIDPLPLFNDYKGDEDEVKRKNFDSSLLPLSSTINKRGAGFMDDPLMDFYEPPTLAYGDEDNDMKVEMTATDPVDTVYDDNSAGCKYLMTNPMNSPLDD